MNPVILLVNMLRIRVYATVWFLRSVLKFICSICDVTDLSVNCCLQILPAKLFSCIVWCSFSLARWSEWDSMSKQGRRLGNVGVLVKFCSCKLSADFDCMCNGWGRNARMGGQSTHIMSNRVWQFHPYVTKAWKSAKITVLTSSSKEETCLAALDSTDEFYTIVVHAPLASIPGPWRRRAWDSLFASGWIQ